MSSCEGGVAWEMAVWSARICKWPPEGRQGRRWQEVETVSSSCGPWARTRPKTGAGAAVGRTEEVYPVPVACSCSRPLVTSVTRPGWLVARTLPVRLCLTDQLSICQTVPYTSAA